MSFFEGFGCSADESTLNGNPYVVEAGGRTWVGPNPGSTTPLEESKCPGSLDGMCVALQFLAMAVSAIPLFARISTESVKRILVQQGITRAMA
jgi:hypothetical protein